MPMIYRSPATRWALTVVGTWAGSVLIFGDPAKWQSAPSLNWLKGSHIPIGVWGVGLILYSLLLIPARTRPFGFALGGAIWGVFAVSLIATLGTAGPKSAVAVGAMVDVVVFHGYSVKTSLAAIEVERGGT